MRKCLTIGIRWQGWVVAFALLLVMGACGLPAKMRSKSATTEANNTLQEPHRPQLHFSPRSGWMNDPNGLVFHNGLYHLFFQHNPDSTVWGPMHWGHATSSDLVHWQEQPIALYPDSLGTIFSGSAVIDKENTSGFGKESMIAIFTHHNAAVEKEGTGLHQNQSIAYSTDQGETWHKYQGNPVLANPGIWDFRDPNVMWYEPGKKWVMSLATSQSITFYGSKDLKTWERLSEFGEGFGAHGGVWECPNLFPLEIDGRQKWVLLVSINPGGPNGGSATQYFTGDFDGHRFRADHQEAKWIDYGPDNYAGITWSGTGKRKVFLGWMSNWQYANNVPTKNWRSAMTIPRELRLQEVEGDLFLTSLPVKELQGRTKKRAALKNISISDAGKLSEPVPLAGAAYIMELKATQGKDFSIHLQNKRGEEVRIGYDSGQNEFYIDRRGLWKTDFQESFPGRFTAPRLLSGRDIHLRLVIDVASVELFADGGLTVMTGIFFPQEPLKQLCFRSEAELEISKLNYIEK